MTTVLRLLLGLAVLGPGAAGAAGPTDIVRVDDYIGAPRALFGRSGAEVERALGSPHQTESGAVATYRDPTSFDPRGDSPTLGS